MLIPIYEYSIYLITKSSHQWLTSGTVHRHIIVITIIKLIRWSIWSVSVSVLLKYVQNTHTHTLFFSNRSSSLRKHCFYKQIFYIWPKPVSFGFVLSSIPTRFVFRLQQILFILPPSHSRSNNPKRMQLSASDFPKPTDWYEPLSHFTTFVWILLLPH